MNSGQRFGTAADRHGQPDHDGLRQQEPPAAVLIKKTLNLPKGSGVPNVDKVGTLSQEQLRSIAETKLPDLNTDDIEMAMRIIAGTARSMGIETEGVK